MKTKNFLFAGLILLCMGGCAPVYYTPTSQNVPLFTQKGESRVIVMGNESQAELQAAYAATPHLAFQLNGGLFFSPDDDSATGDGHGRFAELGAGYYTPIGDSRFVFETYGLVGIGSVENSFPESVANNPGSNGRLNANLYRFGVQPVIGFKSKYFSAALSSRFVSLNYSGIGGSLMYDGLNQQAYLRDNSSLFLIEPALTVRGGFERLQLQLQFIGSANLTKSDFYQKNSVTTLGLIYLVNQ